MATRGRPAKDTETLKRQGTYRSDRHGDRPEPKVPLSRKPADWLTREEKKIWTQWYAILNRNGMLKETDDVAFGLLCKTYNRVKKLSAYFDEVENITIDHISDVGAVVKKVDPRFTILQKDEQSLMKILTEFGLTPSSRAKVKAEIKDEKSPLDKLRNLKG